MTFPTDKIVHPRGKNLSVPWTCTQTIGAVTTPINLTGLTLEVFEISDTNMQSGWTATITGAAAGQWTLARLWDATWPAGSGVGPTVRVRATDKSIAFAPIGIVLQ